jgi:hypothetical protein
VSEPNQLYARVRLSRQRLDDLLGSAFPDPSEDEDVLGWLSTASYYGERYTPKLIRERISSEPTVREWVDRLLEPASYGFAMPARNGYDDGSQTWTLAVLDFSENYDDYIAAVAVFREIAKYKDLLSDDGMLIYGHLFESDGVQLALRITIGSAKFMGEDEAGELVSEANTVMDELIALGAAEASGE